MLVLRRCLQSVAFSALLPAIALLAHSDPLAAVETQPVVIKFQAKVGDRPFQCGANYSLGKPATPMTVVTLGNKPSFLASRKVVALCFPFAPMIS